METLFYTEILTDAPEHHVHEHARRLGVTLVKFAGYNSADLRAGRHAKNRAGLARIAKSFREDPYLQICEVDRVRTGCLPGRWPISEDLALRIVRTGGGEEDV